MQRKQSDRASITPFQGCAALDLHGLRGLFTIFCVLSICTIADLPHELRPNAVPHTVICSPLEAIQPCSHVQAWEYFLMRPDWLIKATQQTSAHKVHKQAVCRLNDAVLKVIAKVTFHTFVIIHC